MKRALLFAALLSGIAFAQAGPTAWPSLDTVNRLGFDNINRENLNLSFALPIFGRKGRGLSFAAQLAYNSDFWSKGYSSWSPTSSTYGWNLGAGAGQMGGIGGIYQTCGYPIYDDTTGNQIGWDDSITLFWHEYSVTDPAGVSHSLGGYWHDSYDDPTTNCNSDNTLPTEGAATDNSGYSVSVDANGVATVYAANGTAIYAGSAADRNGNQMTWNTSSTYDSQSGRYNTTWKWFDTLNAATPVLTMSGESTPSSPLVYTFTDANGAAEQITEKFGIVAFTTNFGCSGISEYSGSTYLPIELDLPNNTKYTFGYDTDAMVSSIGLPTGGTITYARAWNCSQGEPSLNRSDGAGTWNWSQIISPTVQTREVSPLGITNQFNFFADGLLSLAQAGIVARLDYCYNGNCTTPPNAGVVVTQRQITETSWTNGNSPAVQRQRIETLNWVGLTTELDESDWGAIDSGPGPVLRKTITAYPSLGNISDLPSSVAIEDGSGTQQAATCFNYDATAPAVTSGISQHVAAPETSRGNLTSMQRLLSGTCASAPVGPVTAWTYDDTGQPLTTVDPNGNTTQFSYVDNYAGTAPPAPTNAFPTTVTYPATAGVSHIEHSSYLLATGAMATHTDQNGNVTSFAYSDPLDRPTAITFPSGGGSVTTSYTDTPNAVEIETKRAIDSSRTTDQITLLDGFGRAVSRLTANGEGGASPWDRTDTCYDANGAVGFASYPYRSSGTGAAPVCSGQGDSFIRDALGRVVQIKHADGSIATSTYAAAAAEYQDEGTTNSGGAPIRIARVEQWDGLGNLAAVCEVTGTAINGSDGTPSACNLDIAATGFLTSYSHNTLGNLTAVTQGSQTRSFFFDALSRLTSEANPENGTTSYTYDNDSNVLTRTRPAANQTGSATVTTTYSRDALSRLTGVSYSDGATPAKSFAYDQASLWGATLQNPVGRMTSESAGQSAEIFSYDPMGRIIEDWQCTPANCGSGNFWTQYGYDLAGDATSELRGATGTGITSTYGLAQRLTGVSSNLNDAQHPPALASGLHYNAFGEAVSATLGNGVAETWQFDPRGRLSSYTAGPYTLNGLSYAPDGDILGANDSVNGNWSYQFDDLNRIARASDASVSFGYGYDRRGNRWQQSLNSGSGPTFSSAFGVNNQMVPASGYVFDAAGNVTSDANCTYTYDAENELVAVNRCTTATYTYNAQGGRVRAVINGAPQDYVLDRQGRVADTLVANATQWAWSAIFAGGRQLAEYANGTTYFTHADWLGTVRARTGVTGATSETCTSLSFGDALSCGGSGSPSPTHFTGQIHDFESGLDYFNARHYASSEGRFLSPDPAGLAAVDPNNPATWNRYAYVSGNPTGAVDPLGLEGEMVVGGQQENAQCTLDGIPAVCRNINIQDTDVCNNCGPTGEPPNPLYSHGLPYWANPGPDGWYYTARNGEVVDEPDVWEELGLPDYNLFYQGQLVDQLRTAWTLDFGNTVSAPAQPPFKQPSPAPAPAQISSSTSFSKSYSAFLFCEYGHTLGDNDMTTAWAAANLTALGMILSGNPRVAAAGLTLEFAFDIGGEQAINRACSAATYGPR